MNVFDRDTGSYQGRIPSATAPEGAFVYELGHALLQDANAVIGDFHEVSQEAQIAPDSRMIRASIVIRTPAVLPTGSAWELSGWLNGEKVVSRKLRPSKRTLTLNDWRIGLMAPGFVAGPNTIAFRLELVSL